MNTLGYLFAAYTVTWVALFLYIYALWRKQGRVEKDLQRLREKIGKEQ